MVRPMTRILSTSLLCGCLFCASACGDGVAAPVPPVSVTGDSGVLAAVATPTPNPPTTGQNTLALTLAAGAAPAASCALTVVPWMPAHGHGSAGTPTVVEAAAGQYEIEGVNYIMPGSWEIRIDAVCPVGRDRLILPFEVQ